MFVSFDCDLPFSLERKKGWCSTCTWLKLGFCLSINFWNKVPICQNFILQIVYLVIKFPPHQGFEPLDLLSQLKRFYQLTSWHSIRKIGFVRSCYRALFELFFFSPPQKVYVIHWVRLDQHSSVQKAYAEGLEHLEKLVARVQDIDLWVNS